MLLPWGIGIRVWRIPIGPEREGRKDRRRHDHAPEEEPVVDKRAIRKERAIWKKCTIWKERSIGKEARMGKEARVTDEAGVANEAAGEAGVPDKPSMPPAAALRGGGACQQHAHEACGDKHSR